LYCHGNGEVKPGDITALTGDVSGVNGDEAVDAGLSGNAAALEPSFGRLIAAGTHPCQILSAPLRQFRSRALLRADVDSSGKSAAAAVASARPAVFFTRRKLVETALARWQAPALGRALDRLQATVLLARQRPDLAIATARQALIALLVE